MPLSDLHPMAKGKLKSSQQRTTTCSTDLSFAPDNDFAELVWENGHIMVQNQSNRARKNPTSNILPSHTVKPLDKDAGNATNSKMGKYGTTDSIMSDFALLVPSDEIGLNQDDDIMPWFSYSINDSLQHEYSAFLPEVSGVTVNEHSTHNNFASIEKSSSYSPATRDPHNLCSHNSAILEQGGFKFCFGDGESTRLGSHLYPSTSLQRETSLPSLGPRLSEITTNSIGNAHQTAVGSIQVPATAGHFSSSNMETQASGLPSLSPGVINFSHFSRPAALAKANLHSIGAVPASDLLSTDRIGNKDKASVASSSYHSSSMPSNARSAIQYEMAFHSQPSLVLSKVDLKPSVSKPLDKPTPAAQSDVVCQEIAIKGDKSPSQICAASSAVEMPDSEKTIEAVVASSSVCSGNSMEGASNDPKHNIKRKCCENEDSEGPSDDIEEESVGVRKAAPARGCSSSKRSRAAEVHNLSERKRRDRINEKMRALQELIPNCNKVDKASMLDEAIEYLKTLQLQVQIMSMGTGLCMSPMMFPTGMQHMHTAHMGQFSHMGVGLGMGMGVGFGMGVIDMNGGSRGCPMYQASPMNGAHFSGPSISAATSFQRLAGPNLQLFGVPPGQGLPMSMPRPPFIPMSGGRPVKSTMEVNPSGAAGDMLVSDSLPASTSKDLPQDINSQAIQTAGASWPVNQISSQATNKNFAEPGLVREHDQTPDVSGIDTVYPTGGNENVPSKAACYERQPVQ